MTFLLIFMLFICNFMLFEKYTKFNLVEMQASLLVDMKIFHINFSINYTHIKSLF